MNHHPKPAEREESAKDAKEAKKIFDFPFCALRESLAPSASGISRDRP